MINNFKKHFRNSWLFPRYIGIVYIEPAMKRACAYTKGIMLDIGCGTRRYEPIFLPHVEKYIGLDWPQIIDRARPDVIGDAMRIPIKSASIDTLLATELMEHLPSPHIFLAEVARVLRNNGILILSVPFLEPLHEEPRDYYRFTPFSLRLLMEEHGFSIHHIWNKGGWWSVVLGSFVNQTLYDWASALDGTGNRRYGCLTIAVLPLCATAQWLAYHLDRLFRSSKYTLGYTIVAVREAQSP